MSEKQRDEENSVAELAKRKLQKLAEAVRKVNEKQQDEQEVKRGTGRDRERL